MTERDQHTLTGDPPGDNTEKQGLGIAGNVARAFIHSPLSPILFIAMLALGVLGLIITPRQEDPQISVPMIDIFVQYPGATAEQVSSLAIEPLQRIMSEIPGVKHVYSTSERQQGIVIVEFRVGEQLGPSIVKVHDKIQSNLDQMPPGVSMPLVKPKGIDDVPVVTVTLWSKDIDDDALRALALDVLQQLKEVPDTGQSFVVGGHAEQVRIEVLPERLSGYGISLDQVAQTIQTANSEKKAGYVETGGTYFAVKTGAFLRSAEEIKRLVVGTHRGVPVYVRDVADVYQGPEEARRMVTYYTGAAYGQVSPSILKELFNFFGIHAADEQVYGKPLTATSEQAVTIAVAKKEGTNGVTVAQAILEKLESLKGRLIPDNVHVATTRNYGETANDKVNELIYKLFVATSFVFVLVLLAFRALRPAFVVLLVIPVVLLITVFSAWLMQYSINRVSLFALIFAIGILVDDAIVVVENIYRRWLLKGETDTETAVDAVREVGNPTILATFTVVAALLPMGFVRGMMGPYMEPIPALGSVAMVFSLFAAFIFTPWLAMLLKPKMNYLRKAEAREHKESEWLERLFRRLLVPLIDNSVKFRVGIWMAFGAVCAMFVAPAPFKVTVKMLPYDNKPEFNVIIDMPEGTAFPVTANLAQQLAEKLRYIPEVSALQTYVGTAQPFDFNGMVRHYYLRNKPWQGDIHVQLTHKTQRERSSHEIALDARNMLTEVVRGTGARITVVEMPPGPPVLQSVVAEIYGPDAQTRRQVAEDMTAMFQDSPIMADVDNYMIEPYEYWWFEVDTEKAVRRGISVDTINRNLEMAFGDYILGDVKRGTVLEPTYIVMHVPLESRAQVTRLKDLQIPSATGQAVPLAELGRFIRVWEEPLIYYKDLRPLEYVVGDVVGHADGSLGAPIYGMLGVEEMLNNYTSPDGVRPESNYTGPPRDDSRSAFEWGGEWTVTYETFRDMGLAFAAALVLIYILVVWEFGNFRIPLIIMSPIPLTLLGIIPGHWLFGAEFTATSMIGWIALAGIIVRNSILLVDFSIHEIERGASVRDAVILACKTRTRPILITAFALVAGSSVILTDPIFQGMAISLAFGVLVSTLLTLLVIPLGCIRAGPSLWPQAADMVPQQVTPARSEGVAKPALARSVWERVTHPLVMMLYLFRAVFIILWQGVRALWKHISAPFSPRGTRPRSKAPTEGVAQPPPAGGSTPPPAESSGGAGPVRMEPSAATPVRASEIEHEARRPREVGLEARPGEPEVKDEDAVQSGERPKRASPKLVSPRFERKAQTGREVKKTEGQTQETVDPEEGAVEQEQPKRISPKSERKLTPRSRKTTPQSSGGKVAAPKTEEEIPSARSAEKRVGRRGIRLNPNISDDPDEL
jgi:multidrug efflux pump subunit AcrB